jgi:hypothetical protein
MKHIDLVGALGSAFSQSLLEELAGKIGLSADILRRVVDCAAPVLVSALMVTGAAKQRNSHLFAALISSRVNARIVEQFQDLAENTTGLKALEDAGQLFVRESMSTVVGDLADYVAVHSGIPMQAGYVMTCMVATMLAGLLKHHILLEQSSAAALPQLLAGQWPAVESGLTDALARVLRYDDAVAFRDTVPAQLRVLSNSLRGAGALAVQGEEGALKTALVVGEVTKLGGQATLKRSRKIVAKGPLMGAALAVVVAYSFWHVTEVPSSILAAVDSTVQKTSAALALSTPVALSKMRTTASSSVTMASAAQPDAAVASGTVASGAPEAASDISITSAPLGASQVAP